MQHGKLTRAEAIAVVGKEAIDKLDSINCEPTSRLQTDGDDSVEWCASMRTSDSNGERVTVEAYYYLTPEQIQHMADCDGDGSSIDWEIVGYEIEGMTHASVASYLAEIGRKGGSSKSPAKIAAARINGAKNKPAKA
jgi:hypothetical protein